MASSWRSYGALRTRSALASLRTPASERWAERYATRLRKRTRPLSAVQALALESLLPDDPLAGRAADPLEVIIPVGPRDIGHVHGRWALDSSLDQAATSQFTIVTPASLHAQVQDAIDRRPPSVPWRVLTDEALLPGAVVDGIDSTVPHSRRGWARQQLIKWNAALSSSESAVLVVDADTVLLRSRTWLAGEVQLLTPVLENHAPYRAHMRKVLPEIPAFPLSFVAHHQVVQRDILLSMLEAMGGTEEGQVAWLNAADWRDPSALSEYDTYATWACATFPERVTFARWGNMLGARSGSSPHSRGLRKATLSVSNHWHNRA